MDETGTTELQMSAAEMRDAGYRTVDMLVSHLTDPAAPPLQRGAAAHMRELLGGDAPEDPTPFADVLAQLERDVLAYRARGDHPGFFAFISYCGTWPGALGDFVASAANVYASTWLESAGPSQVELEVLGWFNEWIGYPPTAAGILVSGGSAANMTALACARESLVGPMSDDLLAYVPDQAHSSVARAARKYASANWSSRSSNVQAKRYTSAASSKRRASHHCVPSRKKPAAAVGRMRTERRNSPFASSCRCTSGNSI